MPEIIPNWHPIVVHFAIGLLASASLLFIGAAALSRRPLGRSLTVAARWNLGLGILAAALAIATGWEAYNTVNHDAESHVNMTIHMRWAIGTTALFALAGGVALLDRRREAGASLLLGVALVAGLAALTVTGSLGADNVYRYGLGVQRLPAPDDDDDHEGGHHHHHGSLPGAGAAVRAAMRDPEQGEPTALSR